MLDLGFSGFFTCLGLGCAELKLKALGLQIFMAWKKGGGEGGAGPLRLPDWKRTRNPNVAALIIRIRFLGRVIV